MQYRETGRDPTGFQAGSRGRARGGALLLKPAEGACGLEVAVTSANRSSNAGVGSWVGGDLGVGLGRERSQLHSLGSYQVLPRAVSHCVEAPPYLPRA